MRSLSSYLGTLSLSVFALSGLGGLGCATAPPVSVDGLALRRVVVYRNGVAYFERSGHVSANQVKFRVRGDEVNDFLATMAVIERGGSSVRSASFPLKIEREDEAETPAPSGPYLKPIDDPNHDKKKKDKLVNVLLSLDGHEHDLQVGYVAETPVWRPSYRLVVHQDGTADLQAWGIVQNLSGEDWKGVQLSLIAGAPLAFQPTLGTPMIPQRPIVTDMGEVIMGVPTSETSLAQNIAPPPPPAPPAADPEAADDASLSNIETEREKDAKKSEAANRGQGYGSGSGRLGGAHTTSTPVLRAGATSVSGRLPPEVVQRIIRQNFGRFRMCYESGLRNNPNLSGRVSVRFVIGRDGAVSNVSNGGSDLPDSSVVNCVVRSFAGLGFPAPEGGVVTVTYPISFSPSDSGGGYAPAAAENKPTDAPYRYAPPRADGPSAPRNLANLAAIAVEGSTTRYDIPVPITVPDKSATMVMLVSQKVSGESIFLYAPSGGVSDSHAHPFRVARFTNQTAGLLERGPIAVFEDGAFLGQGMVDPLPPAATTTVPFALERAIAVETSTTYGEEGARLAKIEAGELVIERDSWTKTKYTVRNGTDKLSKVLLKHPRRGGTRLYQPPKGTEDNVGTGSALIPSEVGARATYEAIADERATQVRSVDWLSELANEAVMAYLADARADATVVAQLKAAWAIRPELIRLVQEERKLRDEQDELSRSTEETRRNLKALEKNKAAEALRKQLTERLAKASTRLDEISKRLVEIRLALNEKSVAFREATRVIKMTNPLPPPT